MTTVKSETQQYFDTVAADYIGRYYDPASSRYPNLQIRAARVGEILRAELRPDGTILDVGCDVFRLRRRDTKELEAA